MHGDSGDCCLPGAGNRGEMGTVFAGWVMGMFWNKLGWWRHNTECPGCCWVVVLQNPYPSAILFCCLVQPKPLLTCAPFTSSKHFILKGFDHMTSSFIWMASEFILSFVSWCVHVCDVGMCECVFELRKEVNLRCAYVCVTTICVCVCVCLWSWQDVCVWGQVMRALSLPVGSW